MRVELARDVFGDADTLIDLVHLLRCFTDGRHDWVAEPEVIELARDYIVAHAPSLRATVELARKGTVAAQAWTPTAELPALVQIQANELREHADDLCQPAVLVVENRDGDGSFLRTLAVVFGAGRILRALDERWLIIRHGGGSTTTREATEAVQGFRRRVRVAVVLDSDRLVPGAEAKYQTEAAELRKRRAVVHILELREAENYLPDKVLDSLVKQPATHKALDALKTLTSEQRGYFDMKHGFGKGVPAEQAVLFAGIDESRRDDLKVGFGRVLLKHLYEMRTEITENDFASLGDQVTDEIRVLLGKIASVV